MSNKEETSAEDIFISLGVRRNTIRILIYMANRKEVTSDELEDAMGMSQPSVSTAIKELTDKGWIKVNFIYTEGKGRPRHKYDLSKPFQEIVDDIECETNVLINKLKESIVFFRGL
jgi:predicted transcriptional regulator